MKKVAVITIFSIIAILYLMFLFSAEAQISIDIESGLLTEPDAEITETNPMGLRVDSCYSYQFFQAQRRQAEVVPIYITDQGDAIFGVYIGYNETDYGIWSNYYPSYQAFTPDVYNRNTGICVNAIFGNSSILIPNRVYE